jgi:hypothetical protein
LIYEKFNQLMLRRILPLIRLNHLHASFRDLHLLSLALTLPFSLPLQVLDSLFHQKLISDSQSMRQFVALVQLAFQEGLGRDPWLLPAFSWACFTLFFPFLPIPKPVAALTYQRDSSLHPNRYLEPSSPWVASCQTSPFSSTVLTTRVLSHRPKKV